MEEKLKELLSDEEYVKELIALRTPAKIRESLLEHDVDLSENDIEAVIALLKKRVNGELTDDELNEIAGGYLPGLGLAIVGLLLCGGGFAAVGISSSC